MGTKRWSGAAVAVKEVYTLTFSDTWADGDTVTLTLNGQSLTLTVDTADKDVIAQELAAAFNASSATHGVIGSETRNMGGQEIPEFVEASASSSGSVVTFTVTQAGVPVMAYASEEVDTAGDGDATLAEVTAATGPNFFDNANNWVGGVVPADGDTIRFDYGAVSCLYGLADMTDNSKQCDIEVTTDYAGQIGLPITNPKGYLEYRTRYLAFDYTAGTVSVSFVSGNSSQGGPGRCWLNLDGATVDLDIIDAGKVNATSPTVNISGGDLTVEIAKGCVSIEPDDGPASTPAEIAAGYNIVGAPAVTETNLEIGSRCTFNTTQVYVRQYGGVVRYNTCTDLGGGADCRHTAYGGTVHFVGDGSHANIIARNAKAVCNGKGTYASIGVQSGGEVTFNNDGRAKTVTLLDLSAKSTFRDRGGVCSYGTISFIDCGLEDVTVEGSLGI
jgi:hypothetical protein